MTIIALVGMPGSGKSTAAEILKEKGFIIIRFGDVTIDEMKRRDLEPCEENERLVRESLRKDHGMHAFAKLNLPHIKNAGDKVVLDGMYSEEEELFLKEKLGDFSIVAIHTPAEKRYERLASRTDRPLTKEETMEREKAQIENSNVLGPIAHANYTLINDGDIDNLKKEIDHVLAQIAHATF